MSLKKRIQALEKRLGAARDGLPMPDIVCSYVTELLDAEGNGVYGGQPCDSVRASVDYGGNRTYYDRNPAESLDDFKHRVLASHPQGKFARILTMLVPPNEAE